MKTKVEPTVEKWEELVDDFCDTLIERLGIEPDGHRTWANLTTDEIVEVVREELPEKIRTLLSLSVQEAKAEEWERTKKLIEAIHEEFKRDVLGLTNPALSLAAGIEIQINKYEKEIDLLSTLNTKEKSL